MSTAMRDWIAPAIEKSLLTYSHPKHSPVSSSGKARDGSDSQSLTFAFKALGWVQVIDVSDLGVLCSYRTSLIPSQYEPSAKYPSVITLSDGTTKIRTYFTQASVNDYKKKTARSFPEQIQRGFLNIKKCQLVCSSSLRK